MANILGINLSEITAEETLKKITEFLAGQKQHYIVTPNPEIILESHRDEEFFYILNNADLSLADGFGLKIAGLIVGHHIRRVTGSDLTIKLLDLVAQKGIKIVIINWQGGLSTAEEIKSSLEKKFPGLKLLVLNVGRDSILPPEIINQVNDFSPALLFSALGFPYQEKVIYHNLKQLPSVRTAIGVGGSFDFLTGRAKRAPRLFRQLGLEWLWRLIKQPRRYRRIFRATFVFLSKVLKGACISRFTYRPNVANLVYKNTPTGPQILLVEREDEKDHWQLPQGGTDGEDIETAGKREIWEELGLKNIRTKAIFKNVHRYDFDSVSKKIAKEQNRELTSHEAKRWKFDHKGQIQGLYVAEFLGSDQEIDIKFWDHVAWKWVPAETLVESVHLVRRAGAEKFLKKFQSLKL